MEREKLESLIIDYIDGKLNERERASLEQQLARDTEAFALYEQFRKVMKAMDESRMLEPRARMKASFERMLAEEVHHRPAGRQVFFTPALYRAAAAVLLVASGVGAGFWISSQQKQHDQLVAMQQEIEETKAQVQSMLGNETSASQRIRGATVAMDLTKADDEVVNVLVRTMNDDPNSNVRLAALDALSKFQDEPSVRKALITSLSTQKDPIVQIALIQLLVRMKEKSVLKDLQHIVDDERNLKAVKDEAYSGILKLS